MKLPSSSLLLLLLTALPPSSTGQSAPRVVCFYENWARYRPPLGRFLPTNIPPHLCTHIHYVGAGVHAETLRVGPLDVFADIVTGGYRSTVELREHNPDLKVLTMIGGSGQQQDSLRAAAATAESRKQLAEAAVEFLREHDFDGLDVDWKPPHAPEDHAGLLEALRAAFDRDTTSTGRRRLLLAVELTPHPDELREHFDMERVTAAVDYANVLGYRYQVTERSVTSHHAPLRTPPGAPADAAGRDILTTLETLKQMGADMAKLNLAVPTFGMSFTLEDPRLAGLYASSSGPGAAGPITRAKGSLATYEICDKTGRRGWTAARPFPQDVGPYAAGEDQIVAFDDETSLMMKARMAREAGLGGVAVWTVSLDDFRGFCTGEPFPMIRALKAGMLGIDESGLPTTPVPPTTPAYDASDIFVCPSDGKHAASDCEHFYLCSGGQPELFSCKEGETYDEELRACRPGGRCTPQPAARVAGFGPTPTPTQSPAPSAGGRRRRPLTPRRRGPSAGPISFYTFG
ncbi:chitinase-3-like protein 1 [Amphibalanus amphitrite]|uniref:chitinase-3-like protein 1 n=1 Tax=Amphibalanus amphitrite TaxID=1232801 RepID=UPI001C9127DE|nr:chitinase-3-like protein 1 [Amphibalanus amphitrite]